MFPCRIRTVLSVSETQNEAIHTTLETSEPPKEWRSHIAVHFAKIAMIREIDRIQADANLMPAPTFHERQVQMKIPINLRIGGEESREARAIRQSYIILKHIHVGVGKAGVQVNNRTYRQRPREVEHSPTDHAIWHVRRQNARSIRANYRLFEGQENAGHSVQITASTAQNVRNIQVSAMNRLKVQRGLELMVVRSACRKEAEQASTSEHLRNWIHHEQVARLAVDIANAKDRVAPHLAVNLNVADQTSGPGAGL